MVEARPITGVRRAVPFLNHYNYPIITEGAVTKKRKGKVAVISVLSCSRIANTSYFGPSLDRFVASTYTPREDRE
jgi:hypothetical protein